MPKPSDFTKVAQTPSPGLAQLVGPGPLKPPEAMKAVLQHITENKLWSTPGKSFRVDKTLRAALSCQAGELHLLELPKFLNAQLRPLAEEQAALRTQHEKEAKAEPLSARWLAGDEFDNPCLAFDESALEGVALDERTRSFLLKVGLPEAAAPFIDFEAEREGEPLEDLADSTGYEEDRGLRILGVCGDGEEEDLCVCLDERHGGRIVLKDPERDGAPVLMNSGVHELFECLLAYRDLLQARTEKEVDEEPLLPLRLRAKAAKDLKAKDPKAFKPGTFWYTQAHGPEEAAPKPRAAPKPKASPQKKAAKKKPSSPKKKPTRTR